jgi:GNAT superfamily N-acetyltransferase
MGPIITAARVGDAESILKLQYLSYQSEAALYNDYALPPLRQTLMELLAEYDTHRILVAKLGEEIIGSVRGQQHNETCSIGRLIVHPRMQGKGVGTKLMQAIEAYFSGSKRYELFTGHLSERNLRLYRHLG